MRADAVKRRSWLGLLHGELAFWVGRIDGWVCLVARSETLFSSVALVRIPNSHPGGSSATERRNRPSIPLAADAAFRRRGPSLGRRVSVRKSLGHSPPDPAPAASGRSGTARSCDQASLAPVGTRPVSENRQSAMSSLRGERHDHHPADPPAGPHSALVEPLAERAIRLIAQPAPRHLDELCPDPCWTVAADPLVALRVSARPRGWLHTDPARFQKRHRSAGLLTRLIGSLGDVTELDGAGTAGPCKDS